MISPRIKAATNLPSGKNSKAATSAVSPSGIVIVSMTYDSGASCRADWQKASENIKLNNKTKLFIYTKFNSTSVVRQQIAFLLEHSILKYLKIVLSPRSNSVPHPWVYRQNEPDLLTAEFGKNGQHLVHSSVLLSARTHRPH